MKYIIVKSKKIVNHRNASGLTTAYREFYVDAENLRTARLMSKKRFRDYQLVMVRRVK